MKITTELFLMAVKNAGFEVETDGAIYMPVGCDAEESITGNLYELLDAMGIEVGAKHEQGHHPVRWVNPVALRNNYNSSLWATLESSETQSVPLYTNPQHSSMVSVPVEPTPAMIKAIKRDFALTTKGAKRIYEIIITAAQE